MKSLAHIFHDLVHHHGHSEKFRSTDDGEQATYLPISAQVSNQQAPIQPTAPSRQDGLNYLGHLADDYHLPRKVVYAVADAESSFRTNLETPNYERDKHHNIIYDAEGNPKIKNWDYGLMQTNSSNIFHVDAHGRPRGIVKDAHGRRLKLART